MKKPIYIILIIVILVIGIILFKITGQNNNIRNNNQQISDENREIIQKSAGTNSEDKGTVDTNPNQVQQENKLGL